MSLWRLIFPFFLICLSTSSLAQYSTRFFNVKDGLPQSQVLSLAEDKLGYLWVGTNGGGIARFDGKHFSVYTLEDGIRDNYIHKIYVDSHNNIWAATSKGLSKFDGRKFTNYKRLTDVYTQILESNDTLFAVSQDNNLSKIINDSVSCINCAINGVSKIAFLVSSSPDCFYFVQDSSYLHRRYRLGNQKIDISTLGKIHNIFPTGDTVLIIASSGAYRWDKRRFRQVDRRINAPLILTNDSLTTFWTRNSTGLVNFTKNSSGFIKRTIKLDAMAMVAINDAEGNTWVGTSGNGLMKYFANDFEFMGNPITVSVLRSNKKLWVATRFQGVNIYSDNRLEKIIPMESLGRRLKAMREDCNGNIWVSATSDLAMIDRVSYHIQRFSKVDGLKNTSINNIETEPSKTIWVSYRGEGIQYLDKGKFKDFPWNDKLSSRDVLGMKYIPYGDRMMVCTSNGVDEVKNGNVKKLNIPEFLKTPVLCAAPYNKKFVIFGTDGKGLCIYNLDDSSVKYYSKKHGLISGLICFVNTDDNGHVWIGSNYGIEKIKFNEKLEIEEHYYFSDVNGLNGLETNVNASFISGDSKYFGLIDGLYRYTSKKVNPPTDFDIHFTNVELLNSSCSLSVFSNETYGFYKVPLNPQLPFNQNSIRFCFSKVSKRYPESIEYKYMLAGYEKEWSLQNMDGEVSYRNLPPGKYTFKVMANYFSGKWTNPDLEYSFTIAAPFYKTSLFIGVVLLLLVALIGWAIYFNVRRNMMNALAIEEMKTNEMIRLRKEIGRDFHDELGNQLARIVNYVSLIKLNRDTSMDMLTLVEDSAKNLIGGTKDFIWALDHENDSLSNLFVHLKDFGDRLFSEKNIEFRAFHTINSDVKLPVGHTRQINLIMKESMTNCFKHAHATCVDFDFKELLFDLKISLKDNGIGIPQDKKHLRNGGLSNIKERAERINSRFEIHSNGHGTEISLYVKLKT